MESKDATTFSSNQPLLLGAFVCNQVSHHENLLTRDQLRVEVQITEAQSVDGADSKLCRSMPAVLKKINPTISLPEPILIRPDFFYTISISRIPEYQQFLSRDMLNLVTVEPDITIEFHNDATCNGHHVGLIANLHFNKL